MEQEFLAVGAAREFGFDPCCWRQAPARREPDANRISERVMAADAMIDAVAAVGSPDAALEPGRRPIQYPALH